MTRTELEQALTAYAAGLEAELGLLRHLQRLAQIQHTATREPNSTLQAVNKLNDERERLMASLVRVEHEIKPLRLAIHHQHRDATGLPAYDQVLALHRQASDLVATIMASDRETVQAIREAEVARRFVAQTLEVGEATLAAYRRVVTPEVASAALVNRRG
ncbi:MAG TPA: hypothetical protein VNE16_14540 [Vicinamibacterales bacterium]|nr:hypothetical protein [Vicinamibacterales bacterium]